MPLKVITYGDPILRKKGNFVTEFSEKLSTLYRKCLKQCIKKKALDLQLNK